MTTYTIDISRGTSNGTVSFTSGSVNVSTTCWWDPNVKIDAGTYTGYATRMDSKNDGVGGGKRQAIWFGTGVPYNNATGTSDEMFIHKGTNASWSDGCIVIAENKVMEIWNAISPKNTANVTINVSDQGS
jgi:hypothetical protein